MVQEEAAGLGRRDLMAIPMVELRLVAVHQAVAMLVAAGEFAASEAAALVAVVKVKVELEAADLGLSYPCRLGLALDLSFRNYSY